MRRYRTRQRRAQQITRLKIGPREIEALVSTADASKILIGQQEWAAEKRRRTRVARHAIQRYLQSPNQRHRKAALDAVESCSLSESSEGCLSTVLSLIEFAPPEIFWPALMNEWCRCDATWDHGQRLLQALMNQTKPALPFFSSSQRQLFDALPPQVQVFRGCSAPRACAIAWTMDRAIAEGFARGHRGIPVPEPVVASAFIAKEHIFFITDERQEREVILNPRRLRQVVVEPLAEC